MERMREHKKIFKQYLLLSYYRKYDELISSIQKEYLDNPVFSPQTLHEANNFVFRMDFTGMGYGEIYQLIKKAIDNQEDNQIFLGYKMIVSKIMGNQRYMYFDRALIASLLISIGADVPENISCEGLVSPVGFRGMSLDSYRKGSLLCVYEKQPKINQEFLEIEYAKAIDQGTIFHHIVETDHLINKSYKQPTYVWLHLGKLLSAHYATEKSSWTTDLTEDFLQIYEGIYQIDGKEKGQDLTFRHVSGMLKIIIKRLDSLDAARIKTEITGVVDYLERVCHLTKDEKYSSYIESFRKLIEEY